MAEELSQKIQKLEKVNRQLHARVGMLEQQIDSLIHEKDACKCELQEERAQHAVTKEKLADLVHAVNHADERHRAMLRREFGSSSERLLGQQEFLESCLDELDPDTRQYLEDLRKAQAEAEEAIAVAEESDATDSEAGAGEQVVDGGEGEKDTPSDKQQSAEKSSGHKRPQNSGGRKPLPEDYPHVQTHYIPERDHPALKGALLSEEIGRRIIKRMVITPIQVSVNEIDCPIVKLHFPGGIQTQQTITPPSVLGNGQADDSVLIHSACDKVLDHLPAYRQSKRFSRIGIDIHRSKLARWHIALAAFLVCIADAIFAEIIEESVIGIDDTVHRLVDTELHRCKQGRLWAVTGVKDVYYLFSETREGKWISHLLGDYQGAIMGDAYSGHGVLLSREQIIALYCWAHVRRKFFESPDSQQRTQALYLIGQLYEIEEEIADQPPDQKVRPRTQKAGPILAQLKQLLEAWQEDKRILPKSSLGTAVSYAIKLWDGLKAYLTIGEAPIDNNRTERAIRPNAMHRKNSLFSASVKGAKAYATLSTIIQSACNHDLNPEEYLADVIESLHFGRLTPAELTPARYAARMAERVKVNA